jgi:hypothetical protein
VIAVPSGWQSVVTMRRAWLAAGLAGCAAFAGGVSLVSADPLHRLWGSCAACGYAVAAAAVMARRPRRAAGVDLALGAMICGAILVPLLWMVWTGHGEPEVGVVANSAATLIRHGTPYKSPRALAATTNPNAYNPYLPLMAVFGLPQAVFGAGPLTDPRVWFGTVFLVVFAAALKAARARDTLRWALLFTASPVIAFELCVGGDDVPMVAFMCLGFALLWRQAAPAARPVPAGRPALRRAAAIRAALPTSPVAAGLALGVASSMKATAWPALVVAFALLAARDGRRAARRFAAVALAVVAAIVGPFAVLRPGALVKNTVLFPLGLASVRSQAASPLLGHVLAQAGAVGHTAAVIMLVGSGLAIAVSLVVRPPADVPAATVRLVLGLCAMFVLAPSTRFGYFIYPAAMMLWLLVSVAGRAAAERERSAGPAPGPPPGVVAATGG